MNVLLQASRQIAAIGVVLMLAMAAPASAAQADIDARLALASTAAYNLDHEAALKIVRAVIADAPNESRGHRALAGILWLQALFHRGALTVDHYMGGLTRSTLDLPKPAIEIDREFRATIARAIELADARLLKSPSDPDALYDAGAARGLQASWIASVDGNIRAAFGTARRAYLTQEKVLEIAPTRVAAGTIVGTYRYAVSGLGFATRMVAYLAGFSGGKDGAIAMIEAAAAPSSTSRLEARTALALIYSREGRYDDAFKLFTEMAAEFPQNRILVLERGAAAIRAGRSLEADDILTAGIAKLDGDTRRKLPGERALWFYRRGLARLALKRPSEAAADFDTALRSGPEEWIRGRTELGLGKVADADGRRADALIRYRRARDIARTANDPAGLADANRLIRQPFRMSAVIATPRQNVHDSTTRHPAGPSVV